MSKKYLRKNEFRYNTNPNVKNKNGKGHIAYVSVKHGNKAKINTITHSDTFYGEPTYKLHNNPQLGSVDKRQSNYSVPRWESVSNLKNKPYGVWKMSKIDKASIKKINKRYSKKVKK